MEKHLAWHAIAETRVTIIMVHYTKYYTRRVREHHSAVFNVNVHFAKQRKNVKLNRHIKCINRST